ncbi:MAG: hypothetical protein WBP45_13075 [Daejeonella sp.]
MDNNTPIKDFPLGFKWGLYISIIAFSLAVFSMGRATRGITSISTAKFMDEFISSPFSSFSYYTSNGFESDGGKMVIIGLLVYIVHLIAGLSFGRGRKFVIVWLTLILLMNIINLISLF